MDTFSNLADEKRIDEQVLLFTENGSVQSLTNGKDIALRRGVRYEDVYVKQNGRWLIESRKSNFMFNQQSEAGLN